MNTKRREKRPWLSVPWRKKWAFHLLSPIHPMSSYPDSVLEKLAFSSDRLIFYLYEWIKNSEYKQQIHPRKWLEFQKIAYIMCSCSLVSVNCPLFILCSLLLLIFLIFLLYQYYDNLFKQLILNDLIFKLLSIYCSYWRKSG